jgi:phosphoribosylformylglycinamidine synthase
LADRGQIALKYATPSGGAAMGRFPHNPNGSLLDIAGICDATGRVLGLMPHPEAHISSLQHPTWTRQKEAWRRRGEPYPEQVGAGLSIFMNAVGYLQANL